MPSFGSRYERCGDWWFDKTTLEKVLIVATIVSVIIITILAAIGNFGAQKKPCQTAECLKEASRILSYVNTDLNPCDDFYKFACYNFKENASEDEKISLDVYKKEQLLDIYKERIQSNEHRMVTAAKKLFQACTNEVDIEKDGVNTLKEALRIAGGWPVIEGDSWKEDGFDWKRATYKLRELGYEYSIFLELSLVIYPDNYDDFVFQVSSPDTGDYRYGLFSLDKVELMTDVVEMFNKTNRTEIRAEMKEVYKLWKTLQNYDHPFYVRTFKKYTIEEYQKFAGPFDWLDFINKVAGPTATVTKDQYIMFPDPQNITAWLDIIEKTPKRIQANYMMWKVVEAAIPYLNRDLRYGKIGLRKRETHEEFCLRETEKRYYPSPISVLNDRRHVSLAKRKVLDSILTRVRDQLINAINRTSWITVDEKNQTVDRITKLKFLIAQPTDYFRDKILDDLDTDMVTVRNETFLNLIAQANRNAHSWIYSQIKQSLAESFLWKLHIRFDNGQPGYSSLDNSLFIPGVSIQDLLFHERRPHYVNFGSIASLLGYHISSVLTKFYTKASDVGGWSENTKNQYSKRQKCLTDSVNYYSREYKDHNPFDFLMKTYMVDWSKNMYYTKELLGIQIAYDAYESWSNEADEELELVGLRYTPKQLFWISAGITLCGPKVNRDIGKVTPDVVLASLANNENFAKDFNCKSKANMNPEIKCQIFS